MFDAWRDRRLVRRILDGDRGAAERIVSAHYGRTFRLLHHLTGGAEAAQDLTQQSFVRLWQALPTYRGDAVLSTFLYRIALREYAAWLKARTRPGGAPTAELTPAREPAAPGPDADAQTDTLALRQALGALPEEQREAFVLCHVEGLSVREAAAVQGVPPGTVKFRCFAARRRLRGLLSGEEEGRGEGEITPGRDRRRPNLGGVKEAQHES